MPTFTFKGMNEEGKKVAGSKKFSERSHMEEYVSKQGLMAYEIFDSKTTYGKMDGISPKEMAILCRQMSVLFFSQITLMEGMSLLADQAENKQLKITLIEIHEHMNNGVTFAEAVSMYDHVFSPYLINMVIIGEESGTLDSIFKRLAEYYEKESKTSKKMRAAVTYPAVLSVLMAAIVVLLVVKILPMFSAILADMGGEIPGVTKVIFSVSLFINNYLLIIIAIIVVLVVALALYTRTEKGTYWFDKFKLTAPIIGYVNTRIATERFANSLSVLLRSGVQLLNALESVSQLMDNKYLDVMFLTMINDIREGKDLDTALKGVGIFPPLFMKMMVIGQNTGNLDEMLERSAFIFEEEVDESFERLTSILEPLLIIILSIVVGIILISVMLPMINIMTNIG